LESQAVLIAKIIKPQGNRGEVAAEILTDFPERFKLLSEVTLSKDDAPEKHVTLTAFWFHKGRVILKFQGVDTIDAANGLRDYELAIPRQQAMCLPEGSYYQFDLIGCVAKDSSGYEYGKVVEIVETGGSPLLKIGRETGEFLIPFATPFFSRIDIQKKELICSLPEGLTDL
jgi:16S rRNA processing protein RimM